MLMVLISMVLPVHAATIVFNFGAGFSDSTVVAPVGGNTGTTLGDQRQILFATAAQVWGNQLDSSITIVVDAQFAVLDCDASSAVLGAAGPTSFTTDPALMGNMVFYPRSLADALTETDIHPGDSDISATFNSSVDNGLCLGGATFYYGLDDNAGAGKVPLFPVVLHELAHGLGFTSLVNSSDGSFPAGGLPSIFDLFIFDVEASEYWVDMTDGERLASTTNDPDVVWDGVNVTNEAPNFTSSGFNSGSLRLYAPGTFEAGSSISHFTSNASPDLLMEPVLGSINYNQVDVTPFLFKDLGYALGTTIFKSGFEAGE